MALADHSHNPATPPPSRSQSCAANVVRDAASLATGPVTGGRVVAFSVRATGDTCSVQDRIESVGRVLALLIVLVYLPISGDYSLLTGVGIVAAALLIGALNLWPKLFHGSEWLIALIAAAVAFVAVPPRISSIAFYEAAAQIVPILFLALALDARAFSPERHRSEPERRLAVIFAAALLLAGFQVLKALAEGKAEAADFQLVAAALAAATTALAIPAITGRRDGNSREVRPHEGPPIPLRAKRERSRLNRLTALAFGAFLVVRSSRSQPVRETIPPPSKP